MDLIKRGTLILMTDFLDNGHKYQATQAVFMLIEACFDKQTRDTVASMLEYRPAEERFRVLRSKGIQFLDLVKQLRRKHETDDSVGNNTVECARPCSKSLQTAARGTADIEHPR